jgi:lipase chaperone LimK
MACARWLGGVLLLPLLLWLSLPQRLDAASDVSARQVVAPSLRGTRVDGDARLDSKGRLQLDANLVTMFDYYLSAWGERSSQVIHAALRQTLAQKLPPEEQSYALDVFDRYLAFRKALAEQAPGARDGALDGRVARMRRLRQVYFNGEESAGLFGRGDAYDDFMLARLAIVQNVSLDERTRHARLAALDGAQPPDVQAMRRETVVHRTLARAERLLRMRGGDDAQMFALRARLVGDAAAGRLARLDQEKALWQRRLESYRTARQALLDAPGQTDPERRRQIAALQGNLFTPAERLRLAAYVSGD